MLDLLVADRAAALQRAAARHVVFGAGQLGAGAVDLGALQLRLRVEAAVLRALHALRAHRLGECGLAALQRQLLLRLDPTDAQLAGGHAIGVVGAHLDHGAVHQRRDLHQRRLHIGVVGAFDEAQRAPPVPTPAGAGQQQQQQQRCQQPAARATADRRRPFFVHRPDPDAPRAAPLACMRRSSAFSCCHSSRLKPCR
jgi:hypothetical protein